MMLNFHKKNFGKEIENCIFHTFILVLVNSVPLIYFDCEAGKRCSSPTISSIRIPLKVTLSMCRSPESQVSEGFKKFQNMDHLAVFQNPENLVNIKMILALFFFCFCGIVTCSPVSEVSTYILKKHEKFERSRLGVVRFT